MTEPDQLPTCAKEEWNDLSSALLKIHLHHVNLVLPTIVSLQSPRSVVDPQLVHPGYQAIATPDDPVVRPAHPDPMQMIDSAATELAEPELHPPVLAQPAPGLRRPPHNPSHSLPLDNGSLPISTVYPPAAPTPTSSAVPGLDWSGLWESFIARGDDGYKCTWSDITHTCRYESRYGLVKRHVQRVHFGIRYGASVTKEVSQPLNLIQRRFECAICGHTFFDSYTRNVHLNSQ